MTPCKIIGIAGGSGSGKTTFAHDLHAALPRSAILSQDQYYIDQSSRFRGDGENVNFDHPDALDFKLLARQLADLKRGNAIQVPIYDFVTHRRLQATQELLPVPVLLLDGTLILSQPEIRGLLVSSVFIETPEPVRFERRMKRDTIERGRTLEGVTRQFTRQVKPMHDEFVEPSKIHATQIIPGESCFAREVSEWARNLQELDLKEAAH